MVDGMMRFWDRQCEAYNKILDAHPMQREFDLFTALDDKLNLDEDLFIGIYFLDRRTTPYPLSFPSLI